MQASEHVPLSDLTSDPANARLHDGRNIEAIKASLRVFGQQKPIVVDADGIVRAGNGTLAAARALGWADIWVARSELRGTQAVAYAIADNRTAELASWDDDVLARTLRALQQDEVDLANVGFSEDELCELLAEEVEPIPVEEEELPELPDEAVSEPGQLYQLGPHRLICGDSTSAEAWAALLGDERADLVWTDPPYGISYVGHTADALTIENDDLDPEELEQFLRDVFGMVVGHSKPGAGVYVASPAGPVMRAFVNVLCELGIYRQGLVWAKDRFVLGHSDYHYRHEMVFYGWVPGGAHAFEGGRAEDSVHEHPRPSANREHPTMKPVELITRHVRNSSAPGALVVDPFGGSGSTLLAAASLRRRAALIELSPRYCDVIRRRWTRWATAQGLDAGAGALE